MSKVSLLTTFLHIVPGCVHEQKHIVGSVHRCGQQNKNICNARGSCQRIRSQFIDGYVVLTVAQMPRSPDLAIFVLVMDKIEIALPLVHGWKKKNLSLFPLSSMLDMLEAVVARVSFELSYQI